MGLWFPALFCSSFPMRLVLLCISCFWSLSRRCDHLPRQISDTCVSLTCIEVFRCVFACSSSYFKRLHSRILTLSVWTDRHATCFVIFCAVCRINVIALRQLCFSDINLLNILMKKFPSGLKKACQLRFYNINSKQSSGLVPLVFRLSEVVFLDAVTDGLQK